MLGQCWYCDHKQIQVRALWSITNTFDSLWNWSRSKDISEVGVPSGRNYVHNTSLNTSEYCLRDQIIGCMENAFTVLSANHLWSDHSSWTLTQGLYCVDLSDHCFKKSSCVNCKVCRLFPLTPFGMWIVLTPWAVLRTEETKVESCDNGFSSC